MKFWAFHSLISDIDKTSTKPPIFNSVALISISFNCISITSSGFCDQEYIGKACLSGSFSCCILLCISKMSRNGHNSSINSQRLCIWAITEKIFRYFTNSGQNPRGNVFLSHLLALKPALNAPITVGFWAGISQDDPTSFSNHFALLEHLRNGLLPTFNSSYRCEFHIHFHSDEDAIANVFASILQIPQ